MNSLQCKVGNTYWQFLAHYNFIQIFDSTYLATNTLDPLRFFIAFGFMFPSQTFAHPFVRIIGILLAQYDGGVPHVPDIDFATTYKCDAGCSACGTWQSGCSSRPLVQFFPHGVMCLDESFMNGSENGFVIGRPESFLPDDGVHQMLLGKDSSLAASVSVKYPKVRVFEVFFVLGLLVGDAEDIFHVFTAALVAVTSHAKIKAD